MARSFRPERLVGFLIVASACTGSGEPQFPQAEPPVVTTSAAPSQLRTTSPQPQTKSPTTTETRPPLQEIWPEPPPADGPTAQDLVAALDTVSLPPGTDVVEEHLSNGDCGLLIRVHLIEGTMGGVSDVLVDLFRQAGFLVAVNDGYRPPDLAFEAALWDPPLWAGIWVLEAPKESGRVKVTIEMEARPICFTSISN